MPPVSTGETPTEDAGGARCGRPSHSCLLQPYRFQRLRILRTGCRWAQRPSSRGRIAARVFRTPHFRTWRLSAVGFVIRARLAGTPALLGRRSATSAKDARAMNENSLRFGADPPNPSGQDLIANPTTIGNSHALAP